jgi:hypothetical protein
MRSAFRFVPFAIAVAATAILSSRATAQCVAGGPGGDIPSDLSSGGSGGGGAWPSTLPPTPLVSTLAVTVPGGASVLHSVKLMGLSHTWVGDIHVVLQDPSGGLHNIFHRLGSAGGSFGCAADLISSDYEIVDQLNGGPCGGGAYSAMPCVDPVPSGTYLQEFGDWPTGSAGVNNTAIESIPIASGNWTLYIYDWAGGDSGFLTSWELCFGTPTTPPPPPPPAPAMQCVAGGAGGAFPASGAVDGTWPTTLPTGEAVAPLAVTVPAGATQIVAVKINGFDHTWYDDPHIVLEDPSGGMHNIYQTMDGNFGGWCADDWFGDYTFIDGCYAGNLAFTCGSSFVAPGTYQQFFGAWPSGSAGVVNTPMNSIPVMNGTYNLRIYDWYVLADDGSFLSWELCFDTGGTQPTPYCTPSGPNSDGCVSDVSAPVQPNTSHTSGCVITISDLPGVRNGILFYGINGTMSANWCAPGVGTSQLCVVGPPWRTGIQDTGGTAGFCDGTLVLDWDAYQLGTPGAMGQPWSTGDQAWVQGWYRSPSDCRTTVLTEAIELTYQ